MEKEKVHFIVFTRGYGIAVEQENGELKLLEYYDFFGNRRKIDLNKSSIDVLYDIETDKNTFFRLLASIKFEDSRRLYMKRKKTAG